MIADDEDFTREHLARLIKRRGCDVCTAEDGKAAVEMFKQQNPGLVFLDIHMPKMAGDAVFAVIKEIDPAVKVYFMTGSEPDVKNLQEQNVAANGYLLKPIDIEIFIQIIDAYKTAC